jgi:hypothetical protein
MVLELKIKTALVMLFCRCWFVGLVIGGAQVFVFVLN